MLARATRGAVVQLGGGESIRGTVSASVVELVREALRTMVWIRVLVGAAVTGTVAALGVGAVGLSMAVGAFDEPGRGGNGMAVAADRPGGRPDVETLRAAADVTLSITEPRQRVNVYVAMAWAMIQKGDRAGALVVLDRAAEAAGGLKGDFRVAALFRISRAKWGLETLKRMRVDTEARAGSGAVKPEIDAETVGEPIDTMGGIAVLQVELGDLGAARETVKAMEAAIRKPEVRRKGRWQSQREDLAVARLAVGDVEGALEICAASPPAGSRPRDVRETAFWGPVVGLSMALSDFAGDVTERGGSSRRRF
jgi:hypothetical protein